MRKLLCRHSCSLKRRLKLFDATVSKTVLWCTESWNLSKDQLRELQSTQNEMLCRIIGQKRRPDEDWVLWVKHTTRHARILVESYNISLWSAAHLEKKWCWAGKVARMSETCWPSRVFAWRDISWQRSVSQLGRPLRPNRGRPFRWEDRVHNFAIQLGWQDWKLAAQDEPLWSSKAKLFSKFAK